MLSLVILLPLVCLTAYKTYYLKADSANGRFLTWRVSIELINHHLLTGVGFGNFSTAYAQAQHDYFYNNAAAIRQYGALAGDVRFAFNEFLQVFAEGGIAGGILFLLVLVLVFVKGIRHFMLAGTEEGPLPEIVLLFALSGIVVIIISGLTSYPLAVLPLQVLFWLFMALVSFFISPIRRFSGIIIQRIFSIFLLVAGVCTFTYAVNRANALVQWKACKTRNDEKILRENYAACLYTLYPQLADNGFYMITLGKAFLNDSGYHQAIRILAEAEKIYPYKDVYYSLGNACKNTGDFLGAEKQYAFVAYEIPGLLKPHYLLAKLYYEQGRVDSFFSKALFVQAFQPKVPNYETSEMKREINQMMIRQKRLNQ